MRTVAFKAVLDGALELSGIVAAEAQTQTVSALLVHLNRRLRRAWNYFAWPELVELEQRFFRDAWTATNYASGAEVYHAGTDKYWEANDAATGSDVPGVSAKWDEITDLERYVAYEQTGKTAIGAVIEVWDRNPRTSRLARPIGYRITNRGVEFPPVVAAGATSVYVEFRTRPAQMNVTVWDAEETYAVGEEVYFLDADEQAQHGRCYRCAVITTAGQSPVTTAASWVEIEFPYVLQSAVQIGGHIDWLKTDGQNHKSKFEEGDFTSALDDEVDEIVAQQQQQPRWNVRTREAV